MEKVHQGGHNVSLQEGCKADFFVCVCVCFVREMHRAKTFSLAPPTHQTFSFLCQLTIQLLSDLLMDIVFVAPIRITL
jgi:hypothetical protein